MLSKDVFKLKSIGMVVLTGDSDLLFVMFNMRFVRLTSWLLFVMFYCVLSLYHVASWVRCGT